MSTVITSYLYDQKVELQILDEDILITTRYRPVYNRPIKIYQGIDNTLKIIIKNQDQKPVNLTGYIIQLDIQDPAQQGSVASLAVTWANVAIGVGQVVIDRDTVNALDQRIYKATIKRIKRADNTERPMFMDDNFGAQLDLEVLPGWYESMPLTLDSTEVIDGGTI